MNRPFACRIWAVPLLGFWLLVVLGTSLVAQGSKADYERANAWRRLTQGVGAQTAAKVNWLPGDSGVVFFAKAEEGEAQWLFADAKTGVTKPLLSDPALQQALKSKGIEQGRIKAAMPQGGALWIWVGSPRSLYRWQNAKLSEGAASAPTPFDLTPLTARQAKKSEDRGRAKCDMLVLNETKQEFSIDWIDRQGRRRDYGKVKAGGTLDMSTFPGHAWRAQSADRKLVGFARAASFGGIWRLTQAQARNAKAPKPVGRGRSASIIVKQNNVWQRPVYKGSAKGSRSAQQLTKNGTAEEGFVGPVYTSPDKRFAAVRWRKLGDRRKISILKSSPKDSLLSEAVTFGYAKPGDARDAYQLWIFNVRTGKGRAVDTALYANHYALTQFNWLADSSTFTFLYNQRGHQAIRVIGIDAKTAAARILVEDATETFIHYSGKLKIRHLKETAELLMTSERDGWNHLYLYEAKTGKLKRQLTEGEWVVRDLDRIDEAERVAYFWAGGVVPGQDPYFKHWCRVHLDTGKMTVLTEGDGTHEVKLSPGGDLYIDRWSRVDLPPRSTIRRLSDGSEVCRLNTGTSADQLRLRKSPTPWPIPERFHAKGRDGTTDIYGVIFKPSTFDPQRKYPIVEQIYAGPHGAHVPKSFRASHGAQATAELGFIVVQIDGMGTSERSKAFHDVCWRNLADAGFPDRKLWITEAAQTRPYMDLTRVGIYGGSAGGQNAARALLDHNDFYHVAVADCGCHDNRVDKIWWNEQWMGYPIGPWYAESSNTHHASRLKGHLLLILGELDRNVDPASTYQLVDALIRADKDFDLVLIPNAGHGAAGTPYGKRRKQDFLVRHLLNVTPRN